jgi:hypothetical protein
MNENLRTISFITLASFFLMILVFVAFDKVKAGASERIEVLYVQRLSDQVGIIVLHDKDSGIEENCTILSEGQFTGRSKAIAISCVLTGRNWK